MSFFAARGFFGKSRGYVPRAVRAAHRTSGTPIPSSSTLSALDHDEDLLAHCEGMDSETLQSVDELINTFG